MKWFFEMDNSYDNSNRFLEYTCESCTDVDCWWLNKCPNKIWGRQSYLSLEYYGFIWSKLTIWLVYPHALEWKMNATNWVHKILRDLTIELFFYLKYTVKFPLFFMEASYIEMLTIQRLWKLAIIDHTIRKHST